MGDAGITLRFIPAYGPTVLVHGMAVVTRNVADFEPMGVWILNPLLAESGGNGA